MATVAGRLVEPSPESGCGRLLAALREGPKNAAELYRLGMVVHSRIAELRSRYGINVVCEQIPGEQGAHAFVYRLVESDALAEGDASGAGAHPGVTASFSASAPVVEPGAAEGEGTAAAPSPSPAHVQLELVS